MQLSLPNPQKKLAWGAERCCLFGLTTWVVATESRKVYGTKKNEAIHYSEGIWSFTRTKISFKTQIESQAALA
jgi:hypothetical protein